MNPLADKKPALKRLNSKVIHNGEYINLRQDELFKGDDYLSTRDVIEHVGSIVSVPYEIIDKKITRMKIGEMTNAIE